MPKPLLLARPSGLYVRFLVPADLRGAVGARFVVRPLYLPAGDAARLVAARLGLALSEAFRKVREGELVDIDEIVRRARAGGLRELTIKGLKLPNGASIEHAEINTREDQQMLRQVLTHLAETDPLTAVAHGLIEPPPVPPRGPALAKAIADHLDDLERARLAAKTVLESRHTLRIFAEVVGEGVRVAALTQDHVRAFFKVVSRWPANASKRKPYKGKSALEVVKLAEANNEPEPSAHTLMKHQQRLSVFLGSLVSAGLLKSSPLAGVRAIATPDEQDTGEAFTDAELALIFGPEFAPWAAKYPHRWWGTMLGLFSGARVNEVAQLLIKDVETVDDVPGFFVRKKSKTQALKNKNSRRFIPLAKPVLAAGFLDYVEEVRTAGHERLFPNLPNSTGLGFGRQLSRQFSDYIKRLGITSKGQGFHGFRHTFASKLDEAGATESAIGALTGHKGGQSVLTRHYIDRGSLRDRVATLAKLKHPVKLPAYTSGQFVQALAEASITLRTVPKKQAKTSDKDAA